MSDQLNDKDNTPTHGSTQHHEDVVKTHRVENEEDSGSYTDVDLAEPEADENPSTAGGTTTRGVDDDGHYTDIDDLNVDRS